MVYLNCFAWLTFGFDTSDMGPLGETTLLASAAALSTRLPHGISTRIKCPAPRPPNKEHRLPLHIRSNQLNHLPPPRCREHGLCSSASGHCLYYQSALLPILLSTTLITLRLCHFTTCESCPPGTALRCSEESIICSGLIIRKKSGKGNVFECNNPPHLTRGS